MDFFDGCYCSSALTDIEVSLYGFVNAFTCYTGLFLRIQPAAEAGEASGGLKTA
jgi:hypothetical protein